MNFLVPQEIPLYILGLHPSETGPHAANETAETVTARALLFNMLSRSMSDYRRVFGLNIGFIDHFTHDSEIQATTAPSLIPTLYKSFSSPQ
jgi:hypothetical protein